jgi:hypothetical protein
MAAQRRRDEAALTGLTLKAWRTILACVQKLGSRPDGG